MALRIAPAYAAPSSTSRATPPAGLPILIGAVTGGWITAGTIGGRALAQRDGASLARLAAPAVRTPQRVPATCSTPRMRLTAHVEMRAHVEHVCSLRAYLDVRVTHWWRKRVRPSLLCKARQFQKGNIALVAPEFGLCRH